MIYQLLYLASPVVQLGDNCIQNFLFGEVYCPGYMFGNLVLKQEVCRAIKCDFRPYIQQYTAPNEYFEYGYPNSNALLQFCPEFEHCKPHKAARHRMKSDLTINLKLFPTVYHRIYCHNFLTLSNQTSHSKSKWIRIHY